jgi:hypothetical protein
LGALPIAARVKVLWNEVSERVRTPCLNSDLMDEQAVYGTHSTSRVVWDCSSKQVVNLI